MRRPRRAVKHQRHYRMGQGCDRDLMIPGLGCANVARGVDARRRLSIAQFVRERPLNKQGCLER